MPLNKKPQEAEKNDTVKKVLKNIGKALGDSGTRRYSGYIMEEYNSKWRDEARVDIVEEMRRSDATVKGVLRAIKAPILSANWNVVINSEDEADEEVRLFVEDNIFNLQRTWLEFLKEALGFFDFGHYVFELMWEKRNDRVWLRDLEPRIPRSISKWQLDTGEFGITQYISTNDSKTFEAQIPAEKLFILTCDKEGDDVTGQSILRSAHKHYAYKDMLYRVQGISAERFGCGIPTVTMGAGAGDAEQAKAEQMAQNVRTNEEAYIVLPNDSWKFDIITPKSAPQASAIENAIMHHDKQIIFAILATFLQLGSDGSGTGSYALSQDQSSFFLKVCEDMARYVKEQINKQVIKKMVDYNFGEREVYPELTFSSLGDIDYAEWTQSLKNLVDAGLIKVDAKVKQYIHREMNLPELSDEDMEMMDEIEMEENMKSVSGAQPKPLAPDEPIDSEPKDEPSTDEPIIPKEETPKE